MAIKIKNFFLWRLWELLNRDEGEGREDKIRSEGVRGGETCYKKMMP
jgi:hypothetical protein